MEALAPGALRVPASWHRGQLVEPTAGLAASIHRRGAFSRCLLIALVLSLVIPLAAADKRGEVKPPSKTGAGRPPKSRKAPPSAASGAEGDLSELKVEYLERVPEPCAARAQAGSVVSITHKGFVHKVSSREDPTKWVGRQIDGNPAGEPLNFTLRSQQILTGMDLAIEGMCVGEKISVIIPPHLAFDDPSLFRWEETTAQRPAPLGTYVRYEISLVAATSSSPSHSKNFLAVAAMGAVMLLGLLCAWLIARVLAPGEGKQVKVKDRKKQK